MSKRVVAGAVLAALSAAARPAAAQVTFTGYTNGCFDCATPPTTSALQTATFGGLTFTNASFNTTSSVTGSAFLSFGGFALDGTPATYTGHTFTLRATFTSPTGVQSGGSPLFTADLTGVVSAGAGGLVSVTFPAVLQHITFANGSFDLFPGGATLSPGSSVIVTGTVVNAAATGPATTTPEPGTIVLTASGLLAVAAAVRRRRAL